MRIDLPNDYIAYLEEMGVAEGFTEGLPGYFTLWHRDEIEAGNRDLQVATCVPGFLGFGTDGGGELLAFDGSGAMFMLPMIGMELQYANRIADSWREVCPADHTACLSTCPSLRPSSAKCGRTPPAAFGQKLESTVRR